MLRPADGGRRGAARLPTAAHVAATIDVGSGLSVPVIHDADRRTLAEIAESLMDYRIKAVRGGFRAGELAGANILVSLNNDDDVVLAQPIVFPGQTCALSLGGTRPAPVAAPDGAIAFRPVAHLGSPSTTAW